MKGIVTGIVALASSTAMSAFELGSPFTDGMVLQRERTVKVWGSAAAGEEVEVSFAGNTVRGRADDEGRWRVQLPAMKASKEGRTLIAVCGQEKLAVADVLVGEVWLASGQSNMDCPLVGRNTRYRDRQGALVAQMTRKPYVRFARSTGGWRREPLAKAQQPIVWKPFTPENLASGAGCSADIRDNSPSVASVTADGTNIVVTCRDAKGLYLYNDDRSLKNNFELAGADGKWVRASIVNVIPQKNEKGGVNKNGGEITDSDRIVLCAPGVTEPVRVRYWYAQPYYGAIYNEVNLPLGPFAAQVGL